VTVSEQLLVSTVRAALDSAGTLPPGGFSSRAGQLAESTSRAMSRARLFYLLGVSLVVLGLSLGAGMLAYAALPAGATWLSGESGQGNSGGFHSCHEGMENGPTIE
jgi:hypothetical protein